MIDQAMLNKELRLLLTKNCNYDCVFCHEEGLHKNVRSKLTHEDLIYLYTVCREEFDWKTISLTGGEPLLYRDFDALVKGISEQRGEITLVSNGVYLDKHFDTLDLIKRVNVSMHSMDEKKYDYLTNRHNNLEKVKGNIRQLKVNSPHVDVRLNVVLIKNFNDSLEDVKRILDFADFQKCSVKFIELANDKDKIVTLDEIQFLLKSLGYEQATTDSRRILLNNNQTDVILTRTPCEAAKLSENIGQTCKENMNFCITPNGMVNHCDVTNENASIFEELKDRNQQKLANKMVNIGQNFGKNCPYDADREM